MATFTADAASITTLFPMGVRKGNEIFIKPREFPQRLPEQGAFASEITLAPRAFPGKKPRRPKTPHRIATSY
jgi:hypothetical protein